MLKQKHPLQDPIDMLMASSAPSKATTPRRRFDPTPLQRCQKACAPPVPRAKDIVLIQSRLRIRNSSTNQRSGAKSQKESHMQKPKRTIMKPTHTQSSSVTIKMMFQRQLNANGNAPAERQGSVSKSVNPSAPCESRISASGAKQATSVPASGLEQTSGST